MIQLGTFFLAAVLLVTACKKDDDDKIDEVTGNGEDAPQEQYFETGIAAGAPFVLVYGDSLATGVLSNTKLGENIDGSLALQLGNIVKEGQYTANNFQENMSNTDLAAATTDQPYGVRAAVGTKMSLAPAAVGVVSLAKFGGRSQDLDGMLARWQQEEARLQTKPNYVMVMLGGNDFCSDAPVEEISANFAEKIEKVYENSPGSVFVIAPSPPADKIAAIDFTYGPALTQLSGEELSCKKFRDQSCKNVFLPDATARMQGINAGIKAAYDRIAARGAKAVYVQAIADWAITAEDLSFDCFHPSQAGQAKIGGFIGEALTASGL